MSEYHLVLKHSSTTNLKKQVGTHIGRAAATETSDGVDEVLLHLGAVPHAAHQLLQQLAVLHFGMGARGIDRGTLPYHHRRVGHETHHLRGAPVLHQFLSKPNQHH